jgi:hypothetical protein
MLAIIVTEANPWPIFAILRASYGFLGEDVSVGT